MYTRQQLNSDVADIKAAAASGDWAFTAAAAARARTLLNSGGSVGSLVTSRRSELQRALGACESALAGMSTPAPAPG